MTQEPLNEFLQKKIYHWVGKNFGTQEADDPSWDIGQLSKYLSREVAKYYNSNTNRQSEELTVLFRTDADTHAEIERVKEEVKKLDGVISYIELDGKKRLAYSINGEEYAEYIYMELEMPRDKVVALSTWLNVQDAVLRYLLVRKDDRR